LPALELCRFLGGGQKKEGAGNQESIRRKPVQGRLGGLLKKGITAAVSPAKDVSVPNRDKKVGSASGT